DRKLAGGLLHPVFPEDQLTRRERRPHRLRWLGLGDRDQGYVGGPPPRPDRRGGDALRDAAQVLRDRVIVCAGHQPILAPSRPLPQSSSEMGGSFSSPSPVAEEGRDEGCVPSATVFRKCRAEPVLAVAGS